MRGFKKFAEPTKEDVEEFVTEILEETEEVETPEYNDREIPIIGEITPDCIEKYVFPIIGMNKEDDLEEIPIEKRKPITLYINSNGGCVNTGFAIIDAIKMSKTPIRTVVLANAYSMGCLIAMAGHERYCFPHASFLIHDGSVSMEHSTSKFKDFYKYFEKVEDSLKEFIADNTVIPEKLVDKNYRSEWYLGAKEALQYGLVDEILTEII